MYIISQGVTTKAKFYSCDVEPSKSLKVQSTTGAAQRPACVAETGYYMDSRQPCESYSVFGRLPSLDPGGRSVVCTRPGRLADTLGLSHQLMETTYMFIDKSMKLVVDVTLFLLILFYLYQFLVQPSLLFWSMSKPIVSDIEVYACRQRNLY